MSEGDQVVSPTLARANIVGDKPTKADLAKFSPAQSILYNRGLRIFLKGKGLVTQKQAEKHHHEQSLKDVASGSKGVQTRLADAVDEEPDPSTGFYYSDILPVKSLAVSSMIPNRETEPMPYSPQYQVLAGRLSDPAQTGVLASVVRGPNVRDATTMTSLVKALSLRPSTRYEIAAIMRSGAMALSVAEESYACDPITRRFIRKPTRVSGVGVDILRKPGVIPANWRALAMPLDTFVALANNSYYPTTVDGFTYGGLDVNWTAVPVPSRLIGQSHLLPYIYSFLTSDAWTGTTSYGYANQHVGVGGKSYNTQETYMPSVNNIDIPGVKRVCLVLVDETSANCPGTVRISSSGMHVDVRVWRGPEAVESAEIWNIWDTFWSADNLPTIRRDTILAHNEICARLGVSDACGISLSMLAEMYGVWYGGIAPDNQQGTPNPDYSKPAYGAWTYDGSALDKTGLIKSHVFDLSEKDKASARKRTVAYNFSGVSPMHLFPTGLVRMRYVGVGNRLRMSWSTTSPEISVPSYNIQTMTSVMRIATSLGLVLTHTQSYKFASPTGFVHWIHMLACASSFSTSAFLTVNDITPKDWSGIYNKFEVAHRDMALDNLKTSMYAGLVIHHNVENIFNNIDEWDLDIMSEYWLLSAYDDINWMTYSPVPFHCTWQWIEKMGLTGGVAPKGVTTFRYNSVPYMAMRISRDHNEHKLNMVATIDAYRRFPQVLVREPDTNYVPLLHWLDNVAGYSNASCTNSNILAPTDMYESLTFCASVNNIGIPYSDRTDWYVIGSNYEYSDPELAVCKVTPINWPDPPLLDTLWQGAKNYILKPAASALAGFLTGGPTGAAIAGASHIAQQLVTDLSSPETATKASEAISKAEMSAKKVLGLKEEPTRTSTTKTVQPTSKPAKLEEKISSKEAKQTGERVAALMSQAKATESQNTKKEVTPDATPVSEPLKTLASPEESPVNE